MIRYKIDVIAELKRKGYNTSMIRSTKLLNETQLQHLREDKILRQKELSKLCELLMCQPGDLLEYVPDDQTENRPWHRNYVPKTEE